MSFRDWYNRVILRRQPEQLRERASELLTKANQQESTKYLRRPSEPRAYSGPATDRPLHPVTRSMAAQVADREAAARRAERESREREARIRRERKEAQALRERLWDDSEDMTTGTSAIVAAPIFTDDSYSGRTFSQEPEISRSEPQNTPDSWGSSPTSYDPPASYEAPSHSSSNTSWDSSSTGSDSGGWSSSSDSSSGSYGGSDSSW